MNQNLTAQARHMIRPLFQRLSRAFKRGVLPFSHAGFLLATAVLVFSLSSSTTKPETPEAQITNGIIKANLLLPDSRSGYYRGVRFDWSGVISDLTFKGHHYFGKWFDRYEPTLHDAIMGPVDAYDPIGYDSAGPGGRFVKIGVGVLEKISNEPYSFVKPYRLLNGGTWVMKRKDKNAMQYEHTLNDSLCSYRYIKTIVLTPDKPELVITYKLQNIGDHRIETRVFNHNFFVMDEQQTGPDFTVTFPFTPVGEPTGKTTAGVLDGKVIRYREMLNKGETFAIAPLTGFGIKPTDYDFIVANAKTKTSVRIVGDQPIVKFVYWSAARTLCPEPYTRIAVDGGAEQQWTITYTFSAD
jgi:hypothetical protein